MKTKPHGLQFRDVVTLVVLALGLLIILFFLQRELVFWLFSEESLPYVTGAGFLLLIYISRRKK